MDAGKLWTVTLKNGDHWEVEADNERMAEGMAAATALVKYGGVDVPDIHTVELVSRVPTETGRE